MACLDDRTRRALRFVVGGVPRRSASRLPSAKRERPSTGGSGVPSVGDDRPHPGNHALRSPPQCHALRRGLRRCHAATGP